MMPVGTRPSQITALRTPGTPLRDGPATGMQSQKTTIVRVSVYDIIIVCNWNMAQLLLYTIIPACCCRCIQRLWYTTDMLYA